jgi:FKBP-type peptidyl-prolyl cis-trans isomerase
MREGERAHLHVPASLGYGASPQGSPGGAWYIPGNSNLHFDIEIVGKNGQPAAKEEL